MTDDELLRKLLNESFQAHMAFENDPYCIGCGAPWVRVKEGGMHYHLVDVVMSVVRSING